MKTWEGTSWHGYQLEEQIAKIDAGTTWQSAGTRRLTTAKTGCNLGVKKKTGATCPGYDFARVRVDYVSIQRRLRVPSADQSLIQLE